MSPRKATAVLFVDIDSTIRHGYDELSKFVQGPADIVIFPEVVALLRRWKTKGGRIIGVSNQGGIALGLVAANDMRAAMERTHQLTNHLIDRIYWCAHHPRAENPEQAVCWARKPSPGMIFKAILDLEHRHPGEFYPEDLALMVGDGTEDRDCATRAGIRFTWAHEWRSQSMGGSQ